MTKKERLIKTREDLIQRLYLINENYMDFETGEIGKLSDIDKEKVELIRQHIKEIDKEIKEMEGE